MTGRSTGPLPAAVARAPQRGRLGVPRSSWLRALVGGSAVYGCGDGGNSQAPDGRATVDVDETTLGKVLADSHGRSLYLFAKDSGSRRRAPGGARESVLERQRRHGGGRRS